MAISFRDPDGRLLVIDDRVLRIVTKTGAENLNAFLASAVATKFVATGLLARTSLPNADTVNLLSEYLQRQSGTVEPLEAVFEHERITFPSFPYEWAPEMLYRAARLTLDLAESSLIEGFGLKDATPYNVLFRGPQPVFVDLLSFERRDPRDPVWKPYAQFVRVFLLPLLANKYFGLELKQLFLASRDGLEPEEVYGLCGLTQKLRPPFLTLVSIPTWLTSKSAKGQSKIYRERRLGSASQARYILERLFKRLRRLLSDIEPRAGRSSEWTDYVSFNKDHAPDYLAEKQAFVEEALRTYKPRNVLDVGCNTGYFSRIAALGGAGVVAIDQDPATIGALWREASASGLNILPLVVDLARPSPSVGWRNGENPSFLARAQGAFDLVLMLAVVHHMHVSERVPLSEILSLAVDLTRELLIVEFVAPDDPMFQRLTRGRDHLFRDLTNDAFRDACLQRFDVILCRRLAGANRWIYLLKKK
ncbi:MAG TPA: class I SAM-dependent methyltransferase [Blastocatellia bacterium]|jgi:SAM-dependent methyltransferase|nr:class I SAM-dependent methyltransferase [Blastocatellia bacterium]